MVFGVVGKCVCFVGGGGFAFFCLTLLFGKEYRSKCGGSQMKPKKQKQSHTSKPNTPNPTRFLPSTSSETARQESVAVYTRTHTAHAWQFSRVTSREVAQLEKDIQDGTEVLIVPLIVAVDLPRVLCSTQTQENLQPTTLEAPCAGCGYAPQACNCAVPVAVSESNTWTPGEWKIAHSGYANTPFVIYAGDKAPNFAARYPLQGVEWIAEVKQDESQDHFRHAANARLMAAAPDLLRALEGMISAWGQQFENELDNEPEAVAAMAARAKARGLGVTRG